MLGHQKSSAAAQDISLTVDNKMDHQYCCSTITDSCDYTEGASSQCDGASSEEVSIRDTASLDHDC
jgi:hypothetical protein